MRGEAGVKISNLVVSSSFGPELKSEIQGDIPPFRDSYQASAFLATQLAVGDPENCWKHSVDQEVVQKTISGWLSHARLFEIKRTGDALLFPFSRSPDPKYPGRDDQDKNALRSGAPGLSCNDIQPPDEDLYPYWKLLSRVSVALALFILRISPMGR